MNARNGTEALHLDDPFFIRYTSRRHTTGVVAAIKSFVQTFNATHVACMFFVTSHSAMISGRRAVEGEQSVSSCERNCQGGRARQEGRLTAQRESAILPARMRRGFGESTG